MAMVQSEDRRPSPLLSNNPFRNRISSNSPSPPASQSANRTSTNPFLDTNELPTSPNKNTEPVNRAIQPTITSPKKAMTENTRELFDNLDINDRPKSSGRPGHPHMNGMQRRPENMPPRSGHMPAPTHRPSASEEDRKRQERAARPAGELDIFADPPETKPLRERRARRNSESSVRDKPGKIGETDEDKKRRERRAAREKRSGKPKKDGRRLDLIDKLDVTSIYGTGLFHHDGPFDACNPHRNRKGSRVTPMQAFPENSRNMTIGGAGPINSRLNLDQIHGVGHEAHKDYNEAAAYDEDAAYVRRPVAVSRGDNFNATVRTEIVHGEESIGLGTSTFLEGAPASRVAMQRRESELEESQVGGAGLSRKKSLAQRIKSVRSGGDRRGTAASPEPIQSPNSPSALGTTKSESQANPFFKDYDQEYDRKGAAIALAEEQQKALPAVPSSNGIGRARAPSSPKRSGLGLERKMTQDSIGGGEDAKTGGGGLLSRVKSLKGRAKARGEKRDAS